MPGPGALPLYPSWVPEGVASSSVRHLLPRFLFKPPGWEVALYAIYRPPGCVFE